MDLSDDQLRRYARHLILDEVGDEGQERLLNARVLVVGAGGLGAPVLMYLAAAGVGTLGILDHDTVDLTNLQRQVIHTTARVGQAKVDSAAEAIAALNPDVRVVRHPEKLAAANALAHVCAYDLVIDGTDNFPARYLLNDACYFARRPLVTGALLRFDGQLTTVKAYLGPPHPCYRCLFREAPPAGLVPRCEEAGIFGAVAGTIGCLQASEAIKELVGIGTSLSGTLLLFEALGPTFRSIKLKRDPDCPLCSAHPTIQTVGA
jgi:molybdopterin-synthase adenylyltransferase